VGEEGEEGAFRKSLHVDHDVESERAQPVPQHIELGQDPRRPPRGAERPTPAARRAFDHLVHNGIVSQERVLVLLDDPDDV
jgi:hypothetical protein